MGFRVQVSVFGVYGLEFTVWDNPTGRHELRMQICTKTALSCRSSRNTDHTEVSTNRGPVREVITDITLKLFLRYPVPKL